MTRPDCATTTPADLIADALRDTDEVIAVTGATGWLGAVALDLIFAAFGDEAPARVTGYASSRRDQIVADGRTVRIRPLVELPDQVPAPTTLLHFAFLTRTKITALGLDRYTSQNIDITTTVLRAISVHRPRRVVLASSGAVYAPAGGFVSDLRSDPYGTLKRLDELALQAAARDVGGVCVIPRIFSVAGGRSTEPRLYALGDMIAMAKNGGPIEVRARRPVVRSYSGADEIVSLALWAALSGRDTVFDTGGPAVEIGDLARLVAQVHGLNDDHVHRVWDPDATPDRYVGDSQAMAGLAAEARLTLRTLPTLVREMSGSLSEATTTSPADRRHS
jgi:nucleoside-diphosphate-sugar epimerase